MKKINSKISIPEILESSNKVIKSNIEILRKDYFEKTGKKLNSGCRACVIEMILTLKNLYDMTHFKFKRHAVSYKNKKSDRVTISNSTMTDEKAIEFLKTNPERIKLFSEYPTNWQKLIQGETETKEQEEKRIAIEAEMKASKQTSERDNLMRMSLKDLRKEYPHIKAVSIEKFVNKVLAD